MKTYTSKKYTTNQTFLAKETSEINLKKGRYRIHEKIKRSPKSEGIDANMIKEYNNYFIFKRDSGFKFCITKGAIYCGEVLIKKRKSDKTFKKITFKT